MDVNAIERSATGQGMTIAAARSARSRTRRIRLRSRHKRTLLGLAACLALTSGFAYPSSMASLAEPGITAAASVVALLASRSPGERVAGATTSKQKLVKAPRQRALPGMGGGEDGAAPRQTARLLPTIAVPQAALRPDAAVAPPLTVVDLAPAAAGSQATPAGGFPGFGAPAAGTIGGIVLAALPPGGGAGAPPGGGGGGAPPVGAPPGDVIVSPPVSAVPEPGTWLTMLLGFAMIGSGLRRSRRLARSGRTAASPSATRALVGISGSEATSRVLDQRG